MMNKITRVALSICVGLCFMEARAGNEKENNAIDSAKVEGDTSGYRLVSSTTALAPKDGISGSAHIHTFFGFAYTVGGSLRYTHTVKDKFHIGMGSNVGFMFVPAVETVPLFYGAGPTITLGDNKFAVNASTFVYGFNADDKSTWMVLPSIGATGRVSNTLRLHGEVVIPILKDEFESVQVGLFMYGARFGKKIYFDVNFIAPFGGDSAEVYKYFPLGFPVFSLGAGF